MNTYGKELILDLHECDSSLFTREKLDEYFEKLCKLIDMQKCERYFWDDLDLPPEEHQTEPHTKGTSACQFILTSSIVVHTLDILKRVYLNIFSCRDFNSKVAEDFSVEWFKCKKIAQSVTIERI